jgi:hypothetical protein
LAGVISHRERKGRRRAAEGQIYFFRDSREGRNV